MPVQEISLTEDTDGNITGIELRVRDDNGVERAVRFEPDDEGNITLEGIGPNGSKRGSIDPSGGGSDSIGL